MASGAIALPQEPQAPATQSQAAAKTALELIVERFDVIEKRLDQQATATVKILELITSPQQGVAQQQGGLMGLAQQLLPAFGDALRGGSGPNDFFMELYKQAHINYDNKVLMPTFTKLAKGDVQHVTGSG